MHIDPDDVELFYSLAKMEQNGVKIDTAILHEMSKINQKLDVTLLVIFLIMKRNILK